MLNIALVKIMMTYNTSLPNKVDLVLNREISLLVLLKNKMAQPDLFGVHAGGTLETLEPMQVVARGFTNTSKSTEPEDLTFQLRQRKLFELTVQHEKFENNLYKKWGRSEAELR